MGTNQKPGTEFVGMWHIYEMAGWDEDYFNMEVQAYVEITGENTGEFQFGLVSGYIDGEVVEFPEGNRFEFTWDGNDECDPASGSGWIKLKDDGMLEGKFNIHYGDNSKFWARKVR